MLNTIERLTTKPVDPDTLLRARRPLLEAYDNALKTNAGWLGLAAGVEPEPGPGDDHDRGDDEGNVETPASGFAVMRGIGHTISRRGGVVAAGHVD